jgi:hypothetical protein
MFWTQYILRQIKVLSQTQNTVDVVHGHGHQFVTESSKITQYILPTLVSLISSSLWYLTN